MTPPDRPVMLTAMHVDDPAAHRAFAVAANNAAFELLGADQLSDDEGEDLLRRVYAAAYHWARAEGRAPVNEVRAEYMIAKAHWKLGQVEPALHHAERCLRLTTDAELGDFDLAYAHEVNARALALAGREDEAAAAWSSAKAVPIADDEDRAILEADFADAPV